MDEFTTKGQGVLQLVLGDQPKNCEIFNKYLINHSFDGDNFDATEYLRNVYQIALDIQKAKKAGQKLNPILTNIKKDKIGWNHRCYDEAKFNQEEQDDFSVNGFNVVEGVNECNKCRSKRVISFTKQTRGSDEPATTFCQCVQCGMKWSYSG